MSREAMQAGLDALNDAVTSWREEMAYRSCVTMAEPWEQAIAKLEAALAAPVEPVAWLIEGKNSGMRWIQTSQDVSACDEPLVTKTPLYAAPAGRVISDADARAIREAASAKTDEYLDSLTYDATIEEADGVFVRAIIAKVEGE